MRVGLTALTMAEYFRDVNEHSHRCYGSNFYFVPVFFYLGISPSIIKEPNETKVSCSVLN
jgi:hypothetical protein